MGRVLKSSLIILLVIAACAVECAAKKRAEFPPDPRFATIQEILVLPIIDTRAGKKASVNMTHLQHGVVSVLKKKHYSAGPASTAGGNGQIDIEDLESPAPEWVKKLGPADARWVMVVCLDDVTSKMTFGSTGNAEVSGYLFDKDNGGLIWKGKGVGQAGQGGLAGMMMKGTMKGAALDSALFSLLASVPKRPKPGK